MITRAFAVGLSFVLGVHYLIWRIGSSLNLSTRAAAALSLVMLAAELVLLASAFLQLLFSALPGPGVEAEIQAAAGELADDRRRDPGSLPRVAVLVPSCGEPLEVVERSLRGWPANSVAVIWPAPSESTPRLATSTMPCPISRRNYWLFLMQMWCLYAIF